MIDNAYFCKYCHVNEMNASGSAIFNLKMAKGAILQLNHSL